MPASTLSIDEFAALVSATLIDNGKVGGNSSSDINGQDYQELIPPLTNISVLNRPPFLIWRHKNSNFESWPTSSAHFGGSDSFLDSPHTISIEYGHIESATTSPPSLNLDSDLCRGPRAAQMTTCTSEPTVLAASMSTIDFGNCFGGGCPGTSSGSRNSTSLVSGRNAGNTIPTIPIFTLDVEEDPSSGRSSNENIPNTIDLSSTLRLPRTPSPLLQKSADLHRNDPPRNQYGQDCPRTPRKSFFSKLRKQLSSKAMLESPPVPTVSDPNSNNAHSDGSPSGRFNLHLSLPLTPLSLSTSTTPNPSRSPSPLFPFRTASASYKRESAPPTSNERPLPPGNGSPNRTPIICTPLQSGDGKKGRIHSLHDCNYNFADSDKRHLEQKLQDRSFEHEVKQVEGDRSSVLSLADCFVERSEKNTQMNWMKREPTRHKNKKPNSREEGVKGNSIRSSQPFPTFSPYDSDELLSEPSRYSCDSAPRSGTSLKTRDLMNGTNGDPRSVLSNSNQVTFPAGPQFERGLSSPIQPPQTSLYTSPNHFAREPEEPSSYAPFVPLIFQHERLQQKLQKSVPLTSVEGAAQDYKTVACIKSVALKPFPPRTTSLSSSIHVRQRTRSAPNVPLHEKFEHTSAIPPLPTLPSHLASVPTTLRNQLGSVSQILLTPTKKERTVERPTTAPATSTSNSAPPFKPQGAGVISFPVAKGMETTIVGEEIPDSERQRKSSRLQRAKKRNLLSPLQPSVSTLPAGLPSPFQSTGNSREYSNLHRDGDSVSRTGSVGLNYSLSLSKHPYAQARSSEGMTSYPEESDAKVEPRRVSKASVTFVSSATDGESSGRLHSQTKVQGRFIRNLMPPSPTSPTSNSGSGSGSGSDASTKSPVTPRSPLFWPVGGTGGIAAAVKSKIGLGLSGFAATSESEEGNNSSERKTFQDAAVNSDSMSGRVVKPTDDAGSVKKEYNPPHPYSRPYSTTSISVTDNATNDPSLCKDNTIVPQFPQIRTTMNDRLSTASSINHRPSMQMNMHYGVVPSKPPPLGPLPFPPEDVMETSRSDRCKLNDTCEVPLGPVPSEYVNSFSNTFIRAEENDDDSISHSRSDPSSPPSQSSESHENDPEYEALLAANTLANVGELASMRNIGVGRQLMSGYPQPSSSHIDHTFSKNEGKRKRVRSEAIRLPSMSGEWTLFLGNDDTPPRREDIIADMCSVPMTGIKTLNGVRARTKSESALSALGLRKNGSHVKGATLALAPGPSALALSFLQPPVPKPGKKKQMPDPEDWTLSLPMLPPDEEGPARLTSEADLSRARRISDPLVIRGPKITIHYPQPEVVDRVEGVVHDVLDLDDADDMTVAEYQVPDASFGLDIDSLDLEDEDDSLLDYSTNLTPDRTLNDPSVGRLLFSVPRVVSRGSGIECASWGEEVDEEIIKKKRGRRLSDGLESLLGMAGVSVRVDVNEDGESVCIVDGLSLNTDEVEDGSDGGTRMEGHEPSSPGASDTMKENLARLDALSADLKRFNELLKEGVSAATVVDLKHAKSCGRLPSQKDVPTEQLRVQQSLDALRDLTAKSAFTKSTLGVSVKERVKSWSERALAINDSPNVPVSSPPSSPPTTSISMKSRPLPFAPSSPPRYPRPLGRSAALGIRPAAISPNLSPSATGRAIPIATQTKPSHLKVVPAIAASIPDGVVGSGLKVGGNGRVISLSCSSVAAPVISTTQAGSLRIITNETKEKISATPTMQRKDHEEIEETGNDALLARDLKRNSVSSCFSADSFFTTPTSPSQASTPPLDKGTPLSIRRRGSVSSNCNSGSNSPTPTATSPPCLRIITSSTANSTRAHSPVDDVYSPSSSAMPTPLASSFPAVPPLPAALSSLGEDLMTVSKILAATWTSKAREAEEPVRWDQRPQDWKASRSSSVDTILVQSVVPEHQTDEGLFKNTTSHSVKEAERDTESTCSDSFYSARSSFEA